jgi:hypothetical protein
MTVLNGSDIKLKEPLQNPKMGAAGANSAHRTLAGSVGISRPVMAGGRVIRDRRIFDTLRPVWTLDSARNRP